MNNTKVSILCTVYNHEKYISRALQSFIDQKTNFNFEIIVHDDCSTDRSALIIKEYQKKFPDIIKPIFQSENQYSKGKMILQEFLIPKIRGDYFAICEGDDYWIDNNKLQKQVDYMEKHKACTLCIHNSIFVSEDETFLQHHIVTSGLPREISCEEVILGDGGFCSTNSIIAPTWTLKSLPSYFEFMSLDLVWQMYLASLGKTYCFSDYMSAYRVGSLDSWTQRFINAPQEQRVKFYNKVIKLRELFDLYTKFKYHSSINKINCKNRIEFLFNEYDVSEFKKNEYRRIILQMPLKRALKTIGKIYFPNTVCKINSILKMLNIGK